MRCETESGIYTHYITNSIKESLQAFIPDKIDHDTSDSTPS